MPPEAKPKLARKARRVWDRKAGRWMLLYPERGLALNAVAAAVVERCDGTRTLAAIARDVAEAFRGADTAEVERDVLAFLEELRKRALLDEGTA